MIAKSIRALDFSTRKHIHSSIIMLAVSGQKRLSIAEIYQSSHKGVSNGCSLMALQHAKRTIFAGFGQIEREWKIQTEYGLNG